MRPTPTPQGLYWRGCSSEAAFAEHGWENVPALCREIAKLAAAAPDFAAEVYANTYAGGVDRNVVTRIGDSRILSFKSNAKQDYNMGLYSLSEFFPEFLKSYPREAATALVHAVEAYVAQSHPPYEGEEREPVTTAIGNRTVHLKPDRSYVWARDPDTHYAQDGEALVAKFATTLVDLPEDAALSIAERLASTASSAVVWSRLFLVAVRRRDRLIGFLWPFASREPWLVLSDTRKDAVDVVAAGYPQRSTAEKEALERSAFAFDMARFADPPAAKKALLDRLFSAIGAEQLVTEEAQTHLTTLPPKHHQSNERLFRVTSWVGSAGKFDWITDLDRSMPSNATMMTVIEAAWVYLGLEPGKSMSTEIETWPSLAVLRDVAESLSAPDLNKDLRILGEGVIGEGCVRLAAGKYLVAELIQPDPAEPFLGLLQIAIRSDGPATDDDTEDSFERFQSWGSYGGNWVTVWGRRRNGVGDQATRTSKQERYAMNENRVVSFRQKGAVDDPLTEILRAGARRLIAQAVETSSRSRYNPTRTRICARSGCRQTGPRRKRR